MKSEKLNTSVHEQQSIINRSVDDLLPYARNARTHSDAQVAQIAASIREFGFNNPILTHGDGIVAGHGRLLAARKLGMTTVPTIDLAHLTKTQARAYILADNQLALNAGWDSEMLALELVELKADGVDLDLLGFEDVATLLAEDGDEASKAEIAKTLAERFGVPPFTILNAREGWWQGRKRAWLALGIASELGRGGGDHNAAPGGSPMVAGYDKNGKRLTGLKNIGGDNG